MTSSGRTNSDEPAPPEKQDGGRSRCLMWRTAMAIPARRCGQSRTRWQNSWTGPFRFTFAACARWYALYAGACARAKVWISNFKSEIQT